MIKTRDLKKSNWLILLLKNKKNNLFKGSSPRFQELTLTEPWPLARHVLPAAASQAEPSSRGELRLHGPLNEVPGPSGCSGPGVEPGVSLDLLTQCLSLHHPQGAASEVLGSLT